MVLDVKTKKRILEFVYQRPKTIQEIAQLLNVNWRTANSYAEKISQEGVISSRVFREGTRGALKIVFWNPLERMHASQVQEFLFAKIQRGLKKTDFSPFDIYQFVDSKKRNSFIYQGRSLQEGEYALSEPLPEAEKSVFVFSGNLSWAKGMVGKQTILSVIEKLAERKLPLYILTKIDFVNKEITKKLLSINERIGRDLITIRHCEQPLRAVIIDGKYARLKEVKDPRDNSKEELSEKTLIYYDIYDENWISWLEKIFWHFHRSAVDSRKRFEALKELRVKAIVQ
ncbi:hypothetical protein HYV79_04005 [Candidatus Woesearchaeota archaeon]|nr:hypothetical protein [Candidatus Woesearchaeota archaeon]